MNSDDIADLMVQSMNRHRPTPYEMLEAIERGDAPKPGVFGKQQENDDADDR